MQLDLLQADWPALNRLLDEALALDAAERERWLQQLPASDAPLRGTLQQLLAVQRGIETGDFLDRSPPLPETGPAPGDEVGPYRLLRRLGHGGMGTVWLAERADGGLKRRVALKLPRLGWEPGVAARMTRERDILAGLEHPHIARLYDAGVDAQGRPWLALEYVEGQAIDQHCRERGLDIPARVRLLMQVAAAVAYAHSRHVVHRDLKPSNILVGADGGVRLLDFGIAKLLEGAGGTALTQLGSRALTIAYASPEQVRGEDIGPASDIYSLGVVACELLAGARPYRPQGPGAAALEDAIANADTVPPSQLAGDAATARALRGDLDAIVGRALQRDPRERTPSAEGLATDLQRHLDGEPVHARPETWRDRLQRGARRRRAPLAAAALVAGASAVAVGLGPTALAIGALGAGLAIASWQARNARAQAAQAQAQARRADAVQRFMTELLEAAGVGAGDAASRGELTVGQWLDRAARRLREQPAAEAAVQESLLGVVARLLFGLGAYDRAQQLQQDLAQRLIDRGAPALEQARAQRALGETLAQTERAAAACTAFETGLAQLARAAHAATPESQAEATLLRARLGVAWLQQGRLDRAAEHIEPAAAAAQQCTLAQRADLLGALAMLRGEQERLDDARRLYHEAATADAQAGDTLRPEAVERRRALGHLLRAHDHHADAEVECRSALAAIEAAGGPEHPATVALLDDLGHLFSYCGRIDEAVQMRQAASAVVERNPDAFPPLTRPRLQLRLAELVLDHGRIEEAAVWIGAAEAIEAAPGLEVTAAMLLRARHATECGRFDEALRWVTEAHARRRAAVGEQHTYTLSALNRAAVIHIAAGRLDEADAVLDALIGDDEDEPTAPPAQTFGRPRDQARGNRAQVLIERGRHAAAALLARALLQQFIVLEPRNRSRVTEINLRLRHARALLGLEQLEAAAGELQTLDTLADALFEHAPLRVLVDATWADALLRQGDAAAAAARLARVRRAWDAQPSMGPQYRRYPEQVAARLAAFGASAAS